MPILKKDLEEAAEIGAEKALKKLGLSDQYAGEDIRNLRNLLKAFKGAKKTFRETVIRVLTTSFLMGLLAVVAVKLKLLG